MEAPLARPGEARISPEVARERKRQNEVYRYLTSTASSSFAAAADVPISTPYAPLSAQLSRDPVLNGLSQLGALRLGCDRSFISLLDTHHQFIIAETTCATSLYEENQDPGTRQVAFGAGAIDVSTAVCLHTLRVFVHADGRFNINTDNIVATPAHYLIRDFTNHDQFKDRPYVTGWPHMRFYFEVPLLSPGGVVVGSYCVVHNQTRTDPDSRELKIMQEIASAVVQHLELLRTREEHMRASRLLKGLDLFVQGEDNVRQRSISENGFLPRQERQDGEGPQQESYREFGLPYQQSPTVPFSDTGNETSTPETNSTRSLKTDEDASCSHASRSTSATSARSATSTSTIPMSPGKICRPSSSLLDQESVESTERRGSSGVLEDTSSGRRTEVTGDQLEYQNTFVSDDIRATFTRAANLLRESMDLDGVIYVDGCPRSFGSLVPTPLQSTEQNSSQDDHIDSTLEHASNKISAETQNSRSSLAGCLGCSTRPESNLTNNVFSDTHYPIPERSLQHLIQKYPNGTFFHLDEAGNVFPNEIFAVDNTAKETGSDGKRRNRSLNHSPDMQNWFPTARAVIFLPLWTAKSTCLAACIGWSLEATRTLSKGDLTYFSTFGRSVTAEITHLDIISSDRAKSDFISSVSHELRSPLHGILGTAEMLREICPDSNRSQMISMIQNCGISLLETMNHILDFSKINTLVRKHERPKKRTVSEPSATGVIENVTEFNLTNLAEDIIEATLVGHRFKQSVTSSSLLGVQDKPSTADTEIPVCVIFQSDRMKSSMVRSEAGAWRRILVNLLGNALKYTARGHIKVSLRSTEIGKPLERDGDQSLGLVTLSVEDTGQGISRSYLQRHLFQPFAQEDVLSTGTGLGLSIVKQLVDSLGGKIAIASEIGCGTEVTVSVPLAFLSTHGSALRFEHFPFARSRKLNVCLLGTSISHPPQDEITDDSLEIARARSRAVSVLCHALTVNFKQWFNATVTSVSTVDEASGDVVVIAEDRLTMLSMPERKAWYDRLYGKHVVILSNHTSITPPNDICDHGRYLGAPYGPKQLLKVLEDLSVASADATRDSHTVELQPLGTQDIYVPIASPHHQSVELEILSRKISRTPTVLLVDDNSINLKMLVMFMNRLHFEYITATNGLEALEAFKAAKEPIDYVLMDISMPVMDGLAATRAIRAHELASNKSPCVIAALTGLGSAQAQQEAYSSGIDTFLAKPVAMKTILELISRKGSLNVTNEVVLGPDSHSNESVVHPNPLLTHTR